MCHTVTCQEASGPDGALLVSRRSGTGVTWQAEDNCGQILLEPLAKTFCSDGALLSSGPIRRQIYLRDVLAMKGGGGGAKCCTYHLCFAKVDHVLEPNHELSQVQPGAAFQIQPWAILAARQSGQKAQPSSCGLILQCADGLEENEKHIFSEHIWHFQICGNADSRSAMHIFLQHKDQTASWCCSYFLEYAGQLDVNFCCILSTKSTVLALHGTCAVSGIH